MPLGTSFYPSPIIEAECSDNLPHTYERPIFVYTDFQPGKSTCYHASLLYMSPSVNHKEQHLWSHVRTKHMSSYATVRTEYEGVTNIKIGVATHD